MDLGLKGKKAIITGATRGIGRAIAEQLADEGVDLAICARQAEEVSAAVAALSARGISCTGAAVDVSDHEAIRAWIDNAAGELGGVDIFIPNVSAGGGQMGETGWRANFEIDILGTTTGIETALPHLQASAGGAIVIIASTAAVETFMAPQPYNALKAALITHGKQLSQTLAADGIRVNCVSPGPTFCNGGDWDYIKANMPEVYDATIAQIPIGRLGTPEEIANAVTFLASPAASLITGVNLVADGGYTKRVQF